MLVNLNQMLTEARKNHYAVAAFDCVEDIMVRTILDTAEEAKSPVILMALEYDLKGRGMKYIAGLIKSVADSYSIPIALHLDHATNFDIIERAIDNGFTSVMYDGSALSFDENVKNTAHVVSLAKKYNISVEAELGHVAGKELDGGEDETGMKLTEPHEVVAFVNQTGIDCLAVSIGTAHGIYTAEPKLNIRRLQEIESISPVPLVLHGGSGTPAKELTAAIQNGITKINVYSDLRVAMGIGIQPAANNQSRIDPLPDQLFNPIRTELKKVILDRLTLFGSCHKVN